MPDHPSKKRKNKSSHVSKEKAKKILRDGSIRGKKITNKQKGFFGARAGGSMNDSMKRVKRLFS